MMDNNCTLRCIKPKIIDGKHIFPITDIGTYCPLSSHGTPQVCGETLHPVATGTTCLRSKLQRAAATMALAWIAWILTGELAALGSPIQWSITLMRSTGASGIARSQQLSEVDSPHLATHEVYMRYTWTS